MVRQVGKLSALAVTRAKAKGYISDGGGLYLRVGPTGAKSWVFRYRQDGKLHEMGLGPLHTVTLAEAREAAREARKLRLGRGVDPIQARRASARQEAAQGVSFKQAAEAYIQAHKAGWSNPRHAKQWPATLAAYAYPVFGALPVQAIDTALVMKAIEPLWATKTETASRLRGRIESVLDWAKVRGYRTGENPAQWRGHLDHLLPKRSKVARIEHHAALDWREAPAFMAKLREHADTAALALEFVILTACRTGEALGATWNEIDLAGAVWTVPAARMKSSREHRVPLAPRALEIITKLHEVRMGQWVFPGRGAGKPFSPGVLRRFLPNGLTVHGWRSVFRDWCAETGQPSDIAEAALAHVLASKTEAAYQRGDLLERRRVLMTAWARYLEGAP